MKYNLACGHRDFLFREHEDTGLSKKKTVIFSSSIVVALVSVLTTRSISVDNEP